MLIKILQRDLVLVTADADSQIKGIKGKILKILSFSLTLRGHQLKAKLVLSLKLGNVVDSVASFPKPRTFFFFSKMTTQIWYCLRVQFIVQPITLDYFTF